MVPWTSNIEPPAREEADVMGVIGVGSWVCYEEVMGACRDFLLPPTNATASTANP